MRKHVKKELLYLCGALAASLYVTKNRKAAWLPVIAGGLLLLQKSDSDRFADQSVVITGGSRGLGFALARELMRQGAKVTLLARELEELLRAQQKLQELGTGEVHIIECDVTDTPRLNVALAEAAQRFNGIDLLINNAGAITVGPWETMTQEDFEAQIKLHVYAPMNAIRAALPFLRSPSSGKRIVNICSMGGRVGVPHMLPYDTSKFALAGFSQGVAAELSREGISVTTVYPALMRTGSPIQAVFKGDHEKEFAWFQASDVMPGLSASAETSARQIIEAARERRWELMPSFLAKARMAAAAFLPELMAQTMALLNLFMPLGTSKTHQTGAQSRALFDRSIWAKPLLKKAHASEQDLNQTPKTDARYNMGLH